MYNENSIEKLRRLLSQKAEIKNVDYKLTFNWNEASKEDKGKIMKDIIAMANSKEGGIILFGVSNKDMEPEGMPKEDYESFDQTKISDFINNYAYPKVSFVVEKPEYDGKFFVMITVKEFDKIPILCTDFIKSSKGEDILKKGCIPIRTEGAQSKWVETADEWKELFELSINKEIDSESQRMQEIIEANTFIDEHITNMFSDHGRWEIVVYPKFYNERLISKINKLRELINKPTSKIYYGFPYRYPTDLFDLNNGVGSYYPLKKQDDYDLVTGFEMTQSGILVWKQVFVEDFKSQNDPEKYPEKCKLLYDIVYTITNLFLFCRSFYGELNLLDDELHLEVSLCGSRERKLHSNDIRFPPLWISPQFESKEDIKINTEIHLSKILSSYKQESKKIIKDIISKFQFDIGDTQIDNLIKVFPE